MFLNIFCVLALFRLHFFIFRFCLCVLWFTSLSLPLKCFLQNILCSAFLGYIFLFLVFVCVYFGLPPLRFFLKKSLFLFLRLYVLSLVFVCVCFGLPPSSSHFFIEYFVLLFFKVIFF